MPLIINGQVETNDAWELATEENVTSLTGQVIVPFALYADNKDALAADKVAIAVTGDDDLEAFFAIAQDFELVAVDFPVLRDGRGFSVATRLRREGFKGQIRAIGDVSQDRLGFMARCGFDAFVVPEDRFSEEVLGAFTEMSVHYQGAADASRPVYHQ